MKMKKILSLVVTAALTFSSLATIASAESKGTVVVTPTQITDESKILKQIQKLGLDAQLDGYGLFKLDVQINDLGAFKFSKVYDEDEEADVLTGDVIVGLQLELAADNLQVTQTSQTTFPATGSNIEGGVTYNYFADSATAAFPKASTTSDNYSIGFTTQVYAPLGTTVVGGEYTLISFNKADAWSDNVDYTLTVTPFKLGEKKDDKKELGLTIDGTNAKKENGYIWKLNLTQKNGAQAGSFVADFTDSKGDTNQKKAKNNVADFFGEGTVEFYVGLKTKRTITTFKATVADSTAEGVTASDTWTAAE